MTSEENTKKSKRKDLKLDTETECDSESFRQNFDLVTPEGDGPDKNSLWGLPVREFVPDTVISWVEHLQDEAPIIFQGNNVLKKVLAYLNNLINWQNTHNTVTI